MTVIYLSRFFLVYSIQLLREGKDAKLKRAFITGDGETAFDNLQKALSAPSSLFNVDRLYIKTTYLSDEADKPRVYMVYLTYACNLNLNAEVVLVE